MNKSIFVIYCPKRNMYLMDFTEGSRVAGSWTNKKELYKEFEFLPEAFKTAKKLLKMGKEVHVHNINQYGIKRKCKLNFNKETNEAVIDFYGHSGLINQMNAEIVDDDEEERYKTRLVLSEYASREVIFKKSSWAEAISAAFKAAAEDGRDIMRFELQKH